MRIVFAGTPEFAVPALQMLLASSHEVCAVYTQPDKPAGRGRKLTPSPVKALALESGITVVQPASLKNESDFKQLADFNPDLMVVVAYGMILPQSVLDLPKYGCINVHGSLLPRWRGAAPIQRALMAGDKETGVTIMQIVRQLDAGDMLHKEVYVIEPHDTASDLHNKLAQLGAVGLSKVLDQLDKNELHPEKQDEALVTYAEKLDKSESLMDWSQSAEVLALKVRGMNAWPVAQTTFNGDVLRIWRAEPVSSESNEAPGTVLINDKQLDVQTGKGVLRLLEVQLPGGKRVSARDFINAHDLHARRLGCGT
ncbi:MAG: methionyl-tRNA formyltransferase [Methylicorpusculum sp.]|uniref:methionyl-tRNA formyltransferase n=1 Tax=Methylicorpusculum sp. TaxID=2713644 RepID=UPI002720F012|nr:methionyl-tRNA formyltransferase [Methylicorpusculum sp.]MDO8844028.1 methionyl-tRNA formyltransferase [Methylicorpusculum sp.]MDO8939093.1 methionyl-tRNA formyltransferase [Methylicorpusculum sp.]MDO9240761.1 methionyl-tRNA formyltransferase [Methylicorpusculum sp.]MDP2200916.1 methionyl-tRNA formyltransferase [Methylicorpusculum sp.]